MIYLAISQGIIITALVCLVYCLSQDAREERRELEDRLMAICHPVPMIQVDNTRREPLGSISYVGEEPSTARTMRGQNHADAS